MSYNILGINLSHNGSVALLSNGELIYFLEEERLSKLKRDFNPLRTIINIASLYPIDAVAITSLDPLIYQLPFSGENIYYNLIRKYLPVTYKNKTIYSSLREYIYQDQHHLFHNITSFTNSGFKEALGVVIDGSGICKEFDETNSIFAYETETFYHCTHPYKFKILKKSYYTPDKNLKIKENNLEINNSITIGKAYEAVTEYLGFNNGGEEGKTMGLSSYGKHNSNIPNFFNKNRASQDLFFNPEIEKYYTSAFNGKHIKASKEDIAWKIQNDTQQLVGDLIEEQLQKTGLKQVCCSGGYFLNCVANYYLTKRFPNIKFYFEPISSDAGTAIGAAKLAWYQKTQDKTIRSQKTLYHGPQYSKDQLIKGIKKYVSN